MFFSRRNLLLTIEDTLEARAMLAGEASEGADATESAGSETSGRGAERAPRSDNRSRDRDAAESSSARGDSDNSSAELTPVVTDVAVTPSPQNLGAIPPVAGVVGERTPVLFDEGPTAGDITASDFRSLQRPDGGTNLGIVAAGDSLFVNVPTIESIEALDALFADRDFTTADRVATFQQIIDESRINGFRNASIDLAQSPELTLSPLRAQQIDNNRVARIAEQNNSVSFVNNSFSDNPDGSVTLFINRPNPDIDLGDAPLPFKK